MRSWVLAVVAGLFILGCGAHSARADFITNGSFENPALNWPGSYSIVSNGNVPGWTSNNNEIEIQQGTVTPAYNGAQSVELNGTMFDTISQTVTGLTIGQRYQLTWVYAGRAGGGSQQMNVLINNVLVATNTADGNTTTAWMNTNAVFKATSTSATVSFAAIDKGGNNSAGNFLDAVALNTYIPEPASLAIFGAALAGLITARRRRWL